MVVGNPLGGSQMDLAVANSGANNVQVFPSDGGGFFNEKPRRSRPILSVRTPLALSRGFRGQGRASHPQWRLEQRDFTRRLGSTNPSIQRFATGGDLPVTGFAGNFGGTGFTDLVVGNNGDGHLALARARKEGLSLSQSFRSPALPNPTAISFGGVSTAS